MCHRANTVKTWNRIFPIKLPVSCGKIMQEEEEKTSYFYCCRWKLAPQKKHTSDRQSSVCRFNKRLRYRNERFLLCLIAGGRGGGWGWSHFQRQIKRVSLFYSSSMRKLVPWPDSIVLYDLLAPRGLENPRVVWQQSVFTPGSLQLAQTARFYLFADVFFR